MAWLPTSNIPIQYMDENGVPYSGAVLKFYAAGTSTNIAVSTSQTGTPTVTSVALNSDGFPEVSSNTVVIFVDQDYKVALYPTQAAADSNTGALWTIDNIDPFAVLTLPTNLTDINALTPSDSTIIVGDGTEWVAETGSTARTSLGLGTSNSPEFTNVTLSGLTTGHVLLANSAGALTALDATAKGSLIVGDGAGAPTTLAVGTNDQVLTADSAQASGVKWSDINTPGLRLISTATASASATVDFTGIDSTYDEYQIHLLNVIPADDPAVISVRTSTDGGSTYDSGAGNYSYQYLDTVSTTLTGAGTTGTAVNLSAAVGGAANEQGISVVITLIRPSDAAYAMLHWSGVFVAGDSSVRTIQGAGSRLAAANVDAIRIIASSGNIASGIIKLYGVRKA